MLWFLGASRLAIITTYLKILTLLHWLHYGFHLRIGVPAFFAVGCSRVILQLEGLILTYPFGHELCKEEHRNDSSPLSSSWFSISNWANTWERTFHAIRTFWRSLHVSISQNFFFFYYLLTTFLAGKFNFYNFEVWKNLIFWVEVEFELSWKLCKFGTKIQSFFAWLANWNDLVV